MATSNLTPRTILGLKVKRLRDSNDFTLADLSKHTGLSTSYLAEIEAGRKYPKVEKIVLLAEALGCSFDELISTQLDPKFAELQRFLSSPGVSDFPFEMFGVPTSELMRLLMRAPSEMMALLRALNDIARQYNIGVEHFLHAALRSLLELTENGNPDVELAAERFARTLAGKAPWTEAALREWVLSNGIATIDETSLASRPTLRRYRSVVLGKAPARLLLNPLLNEEQKTFALAREAGYRVLGIKARSFTAPADREDSFEQVRNDYQASYFAGALLIPRKAFTAALRAFFRLPTWQPEALLSLLSTYKVTPETLMNRISQLMPTEFGLRAHFLKFAEEDGRISLEKRVNLSGLPMLAGVHAKEQYCRRWLATRLLGEFRSAQHAGRTTSPYVGVQFSQFADTDDAYFNIGMALPQTLSPGTVITLTVGCKADAGLFKAIRFANDVSIPRLVVNGTCERCGLLPEACGVRAAAPLIHRRDTNKQEERRELERLMRDLGAVTVGSAST